MNSIPVVVQWYVLAFFQERYPDREKESTFDQNTKMMQNLIREQKNGDTDHHVQYSKI